MRHESEYIETVPAQVLREAAARIRELEARLAIAERVLGFYAEYDNWLLGADDGGSAAEADGGRMARAFLEGKK